ncbi:MAG: 50S ribosomal protein L29 [Candidatus Eisenbacteria bacterium]|nr:50S ribosomal protein L29 [Candidatus Eisenbacteria bacterium]
MKPFKLREMSRDELLQRSEELGEELFNLRFAASTRALDNPLRLRTIKRERARIVTILQEDEKGIRRLGVDTAHKDEKAGGRKGRGEA